MTNLSKAFRSEMSVLLDLRLPRVLTHLKGKDGTQKFLFEVGQGQSVEAVLIPSDGRLTLCRRRKSAATWPVPFALPESRN